jgi:hypothetical protein
LELCFDIFRQGTWKQEMNTWKQEMRSKPKKCYEEGTLSSDTDVRGDGQAHLHSDYDSGSENSVYRGGDNAIELSDIMDDNDDGEDECDMDVSMEG